MTLRSTLSRRPTVEKSGLWLYALHLWTLFGIALSNFLLAATVLVAPFAAARRRPDWSRFAPALLPLGLYVLSLIAAIVASHDPGSSWIEGRELLTLAGLPLGLLLVREPRRARQIVDGLVAVAALSALYGLAQLALHLDVPLYRVRGPFSHYMTLAGFLLLADLMLAARLACDGAARRAVWRWAALAVINLAMVATLTRGAWVALFVAVALLVTLRWPRALALFVAAAALLVALAPGTVRARVISTFNPSDVTNYDRLCMMEAGARMVAHHPLLGLGPGMVERLYPIYRHPSAPQLEVPHLHSSMVQIAAERGLLSLFAYLWLMAAAMALCLRRYRGAAADGARRRSALLLGAFLALLAFNVAGLFEDNWSDTEVQRFALFLVALPHLVTARGKKEAA